MTGPLAPLFAQVEEGLRRAKHEGGPVVGDLLLPGCPICDALAALSCIEQWTADAVRHIQEMERARDKLLENSRKEWCRRRAVERQLDATAGVVRAARRLAGYKRPFLGEAFTDLQAAVAALSILVTAPVSPSPADRRQVDEALDRLAETAGELYGNTDFAYSGSKGFLDEHRDALATVRGEIERLRAENEKVLANIRAEAVQTIQAKEYGSEQFHRAEAAEAEVERLRGNGSDTQAGKETQ